MKRIWRASVLAIFLTSSALQAHEIGRCERALQGARTAVQYVWDLLFGRKPVIPMPSLDGNTVPLPEQAERVPGGGGKSTNHGKSKSSGNSQSQASDEYTAHNKNTDTPPSKAPANIVTKFNQPGVIYFATQTFSAVNAITGQMGAKRGELSIVRTGPSNSAHRLQVNLDSLAPSGYLAVPFGFRAVAHENAGLLLRQREQGLYFEKRVSAGTDMIFLEPLAEFELAPAQHAELARVEYAPQLKEYPQKWRELIAELRSERAARKITDVEVAKRLETFIKSEMKYSVDASESRGVLAMCEEGAVQCDGAALIFVAILRAEFAIACAPVGGFMSAQEVSDPNASVILDKATPHMFAAVYDSSARRFVVMDPTPSQKTRPPDNQPKEDPRFREWPQPSDSEVGEEAKDPLDLAGAWRAVFETPHWKTKLLDVKARLEARRAQEGLEPDHEIMLRNINYIEQIASLIPTQSLTAMADHVGQARGDGEEVKAHYLRLQVLSRLAPFGARFATGNERKYRRLAEVAGKILGQLPKSKSLDVRRDMLPDLPGPLSREAAESGRAPVHILQQMVKLQKKIRLARVRNFTLQTSVDYRGSFTPTDEDDVDYETAEDFEHIEHFERQGLPPKYDGIRVVTDEMLVRKWREPVISDVYKPAPLIGREATFILIDLSGSMEKDQKGEVRDRLVQMWIDELLGENPAAWIGLLGYRGYPENMIELKTEAEARSQFADMMVDGEYFESKGENVTHRAFAKAVEKAKELGREYRKVNFRLITDGEEALNMSLFRDAKDTLGAEVELNLTAVTLATGNSDLKRFIEQNSSANLIHEGTFVHLSGAEIDEIMINRRGANELQIDSLLPDNYRELRKVPAYLWNELRSTLK